MLNIKELKTNSKDLKVKELTIENFRVFEHIEIQDLGRINLIVGKNNTGKTAVLESIFVLSSGYIGSIFSPFRANPIPIPQDYFKSLFHQMDVEKTIVISNEVVVKLSKLKENEVREFSDFIQKNPLMPIPQLQLLPYQHLEKFEIGPLTTIELILKLSLESDKGEENSYLMPNRLLITPYYSSPKFIYRCTPHSYKQHNPTLAITFSSLLDEEGIKDEIIKELQLIDPEIRDIEIRSPTGQGILYLRLKSGKAIPIDIAGEGIKNILNIFVRLYETKNGILLIDEIENGLHYTSHKLLWKLILEFSRKYNTQVFATTHSRETIESLVELVKEELYRDWEKDIRVIRLFRSAESGLIKSITLNYETLEYALIEYGKEIR